MSLGNAIVKSSNRLSILLQVARARIIVSFVYGLYLLLPISAAIVKHFFKMQISTTAGGRGEGHIGLREVDLVAQCACVREAGGGELGAQIVRGRDRAKRGRGAGCVVDLVSVGI